MHVPSRPRRFCVPRPGAIRSVPFNEQVVDAFAFYISRMSHLLQPVCCITLVGFSRPING